MVTNVWGRHKDLFFFLWHEVTGTHRGYWAFSKIDVHITVRWPCILLPEPSDC